jgi:hypothetical protein
VVDFHRLNSESLDFLPQKITEFLQSAVEAPTSDLTLADAIAYCRAGQGDIYAITDQKLIGAVFYLYGAGPKGKILDVALLGGVDLQKWKAAAQEFTVNLAKSMDCKEVWLMGPKAWGRIFPDMEAIGVVYRLVIA